MSMQVVLASASPRRLELLKQIGIEPIVKPSSFEEKSGASKDAQEIVRMNALGKCMDIAKNFPTNLAIIGADTIVVTQGSILGKPKNEQEAVAMLENLSGKAHQVMTGVAIFYQGRVVSEVCVTDVIFRSLTSEEISNYVKTGEPLDKAGAYGIQGKGAILVEKIDGDYNNVVGLPLTKVYSILTRLGAV
ncbi:MAG: Maf family protein [Phascolarctobacterium sp.]|nr:Maf family protein [Phascolarctobacterium sp.]